MKIHKHLLRLGIALVLLLTGCSSNGENPEDAVASSELKSEKASEWGEADEVEGVEAGQQEIEEVEFVSFEDNEEAKKIADSVILGDESDIQAGFAVIFLNYSFDEMFQFEKNDDKKTIVGYPINQTLKESIEDFKVGDVEAKQTLYDVFSKLDYQFLGVLNGIDDDYEIHVLDEKESNNKLIIFNKDGYLHNSFAN